MLIKIPKKWEMPERLATPESVWMNRRDILRGLGYAGAAALAERAVAAFGEDLYPAKRNPKYTLDRPVTPEAAGTGYNNFYEFTLDKPRVKSLVDKFQIEPWKVEVKGLVNNPKTYDMDDLVRAFPLEERLYRFRCVETWAMAVPWTGFQMSHLVKAADPKPAAKFVRMVTVYRPDEMPGIQSQKHYPWPYFEALTIEEAMNELTIMATGIYGKPLPKQNGAPIRLMTPWKYGLKTIKSIVEIEFTDKRPATLWNKVAASEYGWYSNVNPKRDHPRWSQAMDRLIPDGEMRPTLPYNGYEEFVAGMYNGKEF
jgi:methionine sulfoxide reductase catalytic subunit